MAFIDISKPNCTQIKPSDEIRTIILLNKTGSELKLILHPFNTKIIHTPCTISLCASVKKTITFHKVLGPNQALELTTVCM